MCPYAIPTYRVNSQPIPVLYLTGGSVNSVLTVPGLASIFCLPFVTGTFGCVIESAGLVEVCVANSQCA